MKYLVDMHTHLLEKKINPKTWWKFVKSKKLCAVAITEHAHYNPKLAHIKLLETKPKNILLIPGMEANTNVGHVLIYSTDEKIYENLELQKWNVSIEKVLKIAKEKNYLVSFAHPFGFKHDSCCEMKNKNEIKKLLKKYKVGTEYYNGMLGSANQLVFDTAIIKKLYDLLNFISQNKISELIRLNKPSDKIKDKIENVQQQTFLRVKKAIDFSQNANYVTTGSDAHYPRTIGTAIIELKRKPKNNSDFLEMIRKKEINWAGPNIYEAEPIDIVKKKELLEGIKYATTKAIKKKIKRNKNKKKNKRTYPKIKKTKEKLGKIRNKFVRKKK